MATNYESNDSGWVEERLAVLNDQGEWHPSADAGLTRLREACNRRRQTRHRWIWMAALASVTAVSLAALPVTRAFAGKCISACVAETCRLLRMDQPAPGPALAAR